MPPKRKRSPLSSPSPRSSRKPLAAQAFAAGPSLTVVPPSLAHCQVAEHVQEQLREVDSSMSKPTAESLFQLYMNLQELYQMKDFLPKRYPTEREERCQSKGMSS